MVPGVTETKLWRSTWSQPDPRLDRRAWFANDIHRNAVLCFFLAHPRAENSVGKKQGHVFMKIMENANSLNHHLMYNVHDFFE